MRAQGSAKQRQIWGKERLQSKEPLYSLPFMQKPTRMNDVKEPMVLTRYTVDCVVPRFASGSRRAYSTVSPSAATSATTYPSAARLIHRAKAPPASRAAALHGSAGTGLPSASCFAVPLGYVSIVMNSPLRASTHQYGSGSLLKLMTHSTSVHIAHPITMYGLRR